MGAPHVEERLDLDPILREALALKLLVHLRSELLKAGHEPLLGTRMSPSLRTRLLSLKYPARDETSEAKLEWWGGGQDAPFGERHPVRRKNRRVPVNEDCGDPESGRDRARVLPARTAERAENVPRGIVPARLSETPD